MSPFVIVEFEIASESLTAYRAEIKGNSSVSISVISKSIKPAERFVAFSALVRLFSGVDSLMSLESVEGNRSMWKNEVRADIHTFIILDECICLIKGHMGR